MTIFCTQNFRSWISRIVFVCFKRTKEQWVVKLYISWNLNFIRKCLCVVVPDIKKGWQPLLIHKINKLFFWCAPFGYLYFLSFLILNEPGLGAGFDPGMALTPLPSSIGWGSIPRPSNCEPSTLPLDHSFRLRSHDCLKLTLLVLRSVFNNVVTTVIWCTTRGQFHQHIWSCYYMLRSQKGKKDS